MKTLLFMIALLVNLPLMARNQETSQDQQLLEGFKNEQSRQQEDYRNQLQEQDDQLNRISSWQLIRLNNSWSSALDKYKTLFPEVATDDILTRVNSYGSRRDVARAYNNRREQALNTVNTLQEQITTLEESPFYNMLSTQAKRDIDAQITSVKNQIKDQEDVWRPLGLFDGQAAIEKKLLDAEQATKKIAPIATTALSTWEAAYSDLQAQADKERQAIIGRKNSVHDQYRGKIDGRAFEEALNGAVMAAGGYNKLKSDLILKDIHKLADEMGIEFKMAQKWLMGNKELDKAMANTPMGLYVNKQIARAMGGICNQVATCSAQNNDAAKAFSDMFKFLNNENRNGTPDMDLDNIDLGGAPAAQTN